MKTHLTLLFFIPFFLFRPGNKREVISPGTISISQALPPDTLGFDSKDLVYIDLKESCTAEILEYHPAFAHCGVLATASTAIVKLGNGSLLRVLTLCNMSNAFKAHQKIKLIPAKKPSFSVLEPDCSNAYRQVKKTTFASLENILLPEKK